MDDTEAAEGAAGGKSADESRAVFEMLTLDAVSAKFGLKAKYDAETLRQMLSDGHAIENSNGDPSYPIGDKEDLEKAIRAVGRGSGDHDKIRAYIIRRAKALGASGMIPDDWNSDGSVKTLADAATKALDPNAMIAVNLNGSAGGFDISVNAWCVPAAESDAYADAAQRALKAALEIASGGPVDDDNDATEGGNPSADKSADADALDLKALALKVIVDSYTG
jgi:hypothetical protein